MTDSFSMSNTPTGDWLTCSMEALAFNPEPVIGYDLPLPNGCFKCIGCGKILPKQRDWNQCSDCDTRDPEDYWMESLPDRTTADLWLPVAEREPKAA